jgi:hypothetical protein
LTGPVFRSNFREAVATFGDEGKFLNFCYSSNRGFAALQPQSTRIAGLMEENL